MRPNHRSSPSHVVKSDCDTLAGVVEINVQDGMYVTRACRTRTTASYAIGPSQEMIYALASVVKEPIAWSASGVEGTREGNAAMAKKERQVHNTSRQAASVPLSRGKEDQDAL